MYWRSWMSCTDVPTPNENQQQRTITHKHWSLIEFIKFSESPWSIQNEKESMKAGEQDIFCLLHLFDFWSVLCVFFSSSLSLSLFHFYFIFSVQKWIFTCAWWLLVFRFSFFSDWFRFGRSQKETGKSQVLCLELIRSLAPVLFIQFINGIKFSFEE